MLRSCLTATRQWAALLLALAASATALRAEVPETSSPGGLSHVSEVGTLCPTFSWGASAGAARLELVVLDLADERSPAVALRKEISAKISSWTPDRVDCLRPGGRYGWTVRELDAAGRAVEGENGWATIRRFTVPALPSASEVAAAIDVLQRWQEGGEGATPMAVAPGAAPVSSRGTLAGRAGEALGQSAILGENPAASGLNHGVWGQTASATGAGLVGANLAGGPDLVLEGAAQGQTDTIVTQSGIDRPSATGQAFNIENSGAGSMRLHVEGVAVSLDGHLHSGDQITSGTVAEPRITATLARDSEVMTIVLAGDGASSNLDADLLDGQHGQNYQRRVTGFCAAGETLQGINANGTVVCAILGGPPTVTALPLSVPQVAGDFVSIAVGDDGFPVMSFFNFILGALQVTKCNDPACVGGDETTTVVDDPAVNRVGLYTSIAIGADAFPVMSYYDETADSLKVAKCNDVACADGGETVNTVDNPADDVGQYSSIAIGVDGFPIVSYWDATEGALKVLKCNDAACAPGGESINWVENGAAVVGEYGSIAIGWDGHPLVSYFDATNGTLKLVRCDDAACAPGGEFFSVVDDPDGIAGLYTSLAISPIDGKPLISYFDTGNTALKVAKCTDFGCAGVNKIITLIDNTAEVGTYTSLAFGDDGLPVVSYYDDTNTALKVVRCNDGACTGFDETITTVDNPTGHDVGRYSSIAIGQDGYPVIAYFDDTEDELKVAKCRSRSCLAP